MNCASSQTSSTARKARAEAAAWIVRLHGPQRTPALEAAFRHWLSADEENRLQFERVTQVWDDARGIPAGGITRLTQWSRPAVKRTWAVAAMVLAACGLTAFTAYQVWFANSYRTAIGEQRIVRLEDGSRVSLNSDTQIDIKLTDAMRHVTLVRGEAFFEVAHNPSRPFVVTAGNHDVTAVGTSFLVRYDPDATAVTLVEGQVTVSYAAFPQVGPDGQASLPSGRDGVARERASVHRPSSRNADGPLVSGTLQPIQPDESDRAGSANMVTLTPGERLVVSRGAAPRLDSPNIDTVTAWRRGEVVLEKTTLADAVAEMNRYEDEKLVIDSPDIARLRVSGIYHVGDSAGFAQTIAKLYRLQVTEGSNQIRLLGNPPNEFEPTR
jgi:transmembrane sensor